MPAYVIWAACILVTTLLAALPRTYRPGAAWLVCVVVAHEVALLVLDEGDTLRETVVINTVAVFGTFFAVRLLRRLAIKLRSRPQA